MKKGKTKRIPELPVLEIINRTIGESDTKTEGWCNLDNSWGKVAGSYRVQRNEDVITINKIDVNALLEIDNGIKRFINGESGFEVITDYAQETWKIQRALRKNNILKQ